jgi:hypothetical protein
VEGPGIGAQALAIGTGVDVEECVAAAGPRATAGAAAVAAPFGKTWAMEYLEGVDGAAGPVIQEAARSAPANPRLRTFGYRGEAQIKSPRCHPMLTVRHFQKAATRAAKSFDRRHAAWPRGCEWCHRFEAGAPWI